MRSPICIDSIGTDAVEKPPTLYAAAGALNMLEAVMKMLEGDAVESAP